MRTLVQCLLGVLVFELPRLQHGKSWRRWIDTALDPPQDIVLWQAALPLAENAYYAQPRSVITLITDAGG